MSQGMDRDSFKPISEKDRTKQLTQELEEPDYDAYDAMSVYILLQTCMGMYNEENKRLAIKLTRRLVVWLDMGKKTIMRNNLVFDSRIINDMVDWSETFHNEKELDHWHVKLLMGDKLNEFDRALVQSDPEYAKTRHSGKKESKRWPMIKWALCAIAGGVFAAKSWEWINSHLQLTGMQETGCYIGYGLAVGVLAYCV